jgi:hypothetical protein
VTTPLEEGNSPQALERTALKHLESIERPIERLSEKPQEEQLETCQKTAKDRLKA